MWECLCCGERRLRGSVNEVLDRVTMDGRSTIASKLAVTAVLAVSM
jgi:hypothetical protein